VQTATRAGGRPALIAVDDIIAAGRELGMARLSINAVAARLGVSATAIYRHVKGRWELERLVGEALLAELRVPDDPRADTEEHLLAFGLRLCEFAAEHPGLASYLQVLFPRGETGTRLLAEQVEALAARGYTAEAAVVLSSAVATVALSLTAREEHNAEATGDDAGGFAAERDAAADRLATDSHLGPPHSALPEVSGVGFVRLLLTASIRGLVAAIPPQRPIADVVAELSAAGEGR
jgi:AcrR family transcriptional regulator